MGLIDIPISGNSAKPLRESMELVYASVLTSTPPGPYLGRLVNAIASLQRRSQPTEIDRRLLRQHLHWILMCCRLLRKRKVNIDEFASLASELGASTDNPHYVGITASLLSRDGAGEKAGRLLHEWLQKPEIRSGHLRARMLLTTAIAALHDAQALDALKSDARRIATYHMLKMPASLFGNRAEILALLTSSNQEE